MKQAVWVSRKYEPIFKGSSERGYRIEVEGFDAGQFELVVALYWFHSSNEAKMEQTQPILVGSHSFHEYTPCDLKRSEVRGSRKLVRVRIEPLKKGKKDSEPPLDLIVPSKHRKCTSINEPGRWLQHPVDGKCRPPICTGDLFESRISRPSWQGSRFGWVWVPYNCHYHAYDRTDFLRCAKEKDISWIHVMGDSLSREHVGYLMSLFDNAVTTKFETADVQLEDGVSDSVRLTFHFWPDIFLFAEKDIFRDFNFTRTMLDHWNILERETSTPFEFHILETYGDLLEKEETRPDVFIMNPATAYCLFRQTEPVSSWMCLFLTYFITQAFRSYVKSFAEMISHSSPEEGTPHIFWYHSPFLFGTAHARTEFITQTRNERFSRIAQ